VARPGSNPGPPKWGWRKTPIISGRGFLLVILITWATFASSAALPHSRYSPNLAKDSSRIARR
jgi:hypothetical protein